MTQVLWLPLNIIIIITYSRTISIIHSSIVFRYMVYNLDGFFKDYHTGLTQFSSVDWTEMEEIRTPREKGETPGLESS